MTQRLFIFLMSLTLSSSFAFAESTESKTLQSMRNATERLQTLQKDPKKANESEVLQETWDTLYASATSSAGEAGSEEFLHEFFTLTDTYLQADESGAAMDVFSDYYERKKNLIEVYKKSKTRKTNYELIERVLKQEKNYGRATDPSPKASAAPGSGSISREPSKFR